MTANTTAIITSVVTFVAETSHIFSDSNSVWNLFYPPQVTTPISVVMRVAVFVFNDSVFDHSMAHSPGTSDSSADTSRAYFGFAYTSASTCLTPTSTFPVSSACPN
jgi:hypothetical protein